MALKQVKCRVHPHEPSHPTGSYDVKIGCSRLPEVLKNWDGKKFPPRIAIEQPDEDTNLTLLTIMFAKPDTPYPPSLKGLTFRNARVWEIKKLKCPASRRDPKQAETVAAWDRMVPSHFSINVKARYIKQLTHPMPAGGWDGTVEEGSGWVCFRIQAVTLKVTGIEKKRTILQPGDDDYEDTLRDARSSIETP